jgi:hypothetical protein
LIRSSKVIPMSNSENKPGSDAKDEETVITPIDVDGAMGEGGDQVVRSALSLLLLSGRPFRLSRIRADRDHPRLRPPALGGGAGRIPGFRCSGQW